MRKFYCIYNSSCTQSLDMEDRIQSLKKACESLNILFEPLDEAIVDFSILPSPTEKDALYNCGRGSYLLESVLINKKVRTFYRRYPLHSQKDDSNFLNFELKKQNIPLPKTIYKGTNDKKLLAKYIEQVGGFPVILKNYGGVSGIGVIKVDNCETLNSIADYFISVDQPFQIKEYIPADSCERVVVLGDEVIYTISRPVKENDFRSDGYSKETRKIELPADIKKVAVDAAHAANLNFAGIDILISKKDSKPYVLEVNCPHNFAQHEKITGENYASKMIAWLFR